MRLARWQGLEGQSEVLGSHGKVLSRGGIGSSVNFKNTPLASVWWEDGSGRGWDRRAGMKLGWRPGGRGGGGMVGVGGVEGGCLLQSLSFLVPRSRRGSHRPCAHQAEPYPLPVRKLCLCPHCGRTCGTGRKRGLHHNLEAKVPAFPPSHPVSPRKVQSSLCSKTEAKPTASSQGA